MSTINIISSLCLFTASNNFCDRGVSQSHLLPLNKIHDNKMGNQNTSPKARATKKLSDHNEVKHGHGMTNGTNGDHKVPHVNVI